METRKGFIIRLISGKKLKELKVTEVHRVTQLDSTKVQGEPNKIRQLTLLPKRAVLRIGMLLTESEVAP